MQHKTKINGGILVQHWNVWKNYHTAKANVCHFWHGKFNEVILQDILEHFPWSWSDLELIFCSAWLMLVNMDPWVAPSVSSSRILWPLKIKKGGKGLPMANLGGECSGEKPLSPMLYIKLGAENMSYVSKIWFWKILEVCFHSFLLFFIVVWGTPVNFEAL